MLIGDNVVSSLEEQHSSVSRRRRCARNLRHRRARRFDRQPRNSGEPGGGSSKPRWPCDTAREVRDVPRKCSAGLPAATCAQNPTSKKIPETDDIFANLRQVHTQAANDPDTLRISIDTKAKLKIGAFSRHGLARGAAAVQAADHDMDPAAVLAPAGILEVLQDQHQLTLELAYYPPDHSKYNPIERCWGVLENHWNGTLLTSIATALRWARTMTWRGVSPVVHLLDRVYDKGVRLSRAAFRPIAARLERSATLSKWSLVIQPQPS